MDAGLLIQLISGAAGGNAAGSLFRDRSLGALGNSLAGAVGGGLGGQILTAMLGVGAAGAGALDLGALIAQIVGGGLGGAILMLAVGVLKQTFAK